MVLETLKITLVLDASTGPAQLRDLADFIEKRVFAGTASPTSEEQDLKEEAPKKAKKKKTVKVKEDPFEEEDSQLEMEAIKDETDFMTEREEDDNDDSDSDMPTTDLSSFDSDDDSLGEEVEDSPSAKRSKKVDEETKTPKAAKAAKTKTPSLTMQDVIEAAKACARRHGGGDGGFKATMKVLEKHFKTKSVQNIPEHQFQKAVGLFSRA